MLLQVPSSMLNNYHKNICNLDKIAITHKKHIQNIYDQIWQFHISMCQYSIDIDVWIEASLMKSKTYVNNQINNQEEQKKEENN